MDYVSRNHSKYLLMCHLIFVCKYRKKLLVRYDKELVSKNCEQRLLLHELFHIKLDLPYDYYDNGKDTIEKREFYNNNHQLVDSMTKSVLMIQYNLDFSWFKNY